jgi:hypothetical protein
MGVELGLQILSEGNRLSAFGKREIYVKRSQKMVKTAEWKAS